MPKTKISTVSQFSSKTMAIIGMPKNVRIRLGHERKRPGKNRIVNSARKIRRQLLTSEVLPDWDGDMQVSDFLAQIEALIVTDLAADGVHLVLRLKGRRKPFNGNTKLRTVVKKALEQSASSLGFHSLDNLSKVLERAGLPSVDMPTAGLLYQFLAKLVGKSFNEAMNAPSKVFEAKLAEAA